MKTRMLVTIKYLTDILVYPGTERPAGSQTGYPVPAIDLDQCNAHSKDLVFVLQCGRITRSALCNRYASVVYS